MFHPASERTPARRRGRWLSLTLLLLAACSKGPEIRPGGADAIVLIVIDTLRADFLGSYGYANETSPHLDALARSGIRFHDVTTAVPVTLPSVTTILTGRYPYEHGVRDNAGFVLSAEEETLTERFRAEGWRTGAVVASAVLSADRGLAQGFEIYDDEFGGEYPVYNPDLMPLQEEISQDRRRADAVTDRAIEIIDGFGDAPYFLFVHYFDVHSHYDPPPEHGNLFPGNGYAGEIHFVDAEIGRLLARVNVGRRPLVAVVADHGEGLGEHGEAGHGFLLHQATLRVPFIVSGPGVPRHGLRTDAIATIDIEPTLAQSTNLPPTQSPRTGRALRWTLAEEDVPYHYSETFRTLFSYDWSHLRSLRGGAFKLVEGPYDELFNLEADPRELNPLDPSTAPGPTLKTTLRQMIGDDDARHLLREMDEPDPERLETLESLGYVSGGGESTSPDADGGEYWLPHPAERLERWTARQQNRVNYRKATASLERGEFDQALALLDSVLVEDPDHLEARYNRGVTLWNLARRDEAREEFRAVLEQDPQYLPVLKLFSQIRLQSANYEGAFVLLQRWADQEPDDANAFYNLGACAQRLGKTEVARESLTRFLELAPDHERAADVRQLLSQLE